MKPAALVFLDDPMARKLAVAWTTKPKDHDAWLAAAGLTRQGQRRQALALCDCLETNGICTEGGVVPEQVLRYIAAVSVKGLNIGKAR